MSRRLLPRINLGDLQAIVDARAESTLPAAVDASYPDGSWGAHLLQSHPDLPRVANVEALAAAVPVLLRIAESALCAVEAMHAMEAWVPDMAKVKESDAVFSALRAAVRTTRVDLEVALDKVER